MPARPGSAEKGFETSRNCFNLSTHTLHCKTFCTALACATLPPRTDRARVPSCCPCLCPGDSRDSPAQVFVPSTAGRACPVQGEQQLGLGWAGRRELQRWRCSRGPVPRPGQQRGRQC